MNIIGWLLFLFGLYLLVTGKAGTFISFATTKGSPTSTSAGGGLASLTALTPLFGTSGGATNGSASGGTIGLA